MRTMTVIMLVANVVMARNQGPDPLIHASAEAAHAQRLFHDQPAGCAAVAASMPGDQQHRGQSAFRRARAHAPRLSLAARHGRAMVGGSVSGNREVVPENHGLPGPVGPEGDPGWIAASHRAGGGVE